MYTAKARIMHEDKVVGFNIINDENNKSYRVSLKGFIKLCNDGEISNAYLQLGSGKCNIQGKGCKILDMVDIEYEDLLYAIDSRRHKSKELDTEKGNKHKASDEIFKIGKFIRKSSIKYTEDNVIESGISDIIYSISGDINWKSSEDYGVLGFIDKVLDILISSLAELINLPAYFCEYELGEINKMDVGNNEYCIYLPYTCDNRIDFRNMWGGRDYDIVYIYILVYVRKEHDGVFKIGHAYYDVVAYGDEYGVRELARCSIDFERNTGFGVDLSDFWNVFDSDAVYAEKYKRNRGDGRYGSKIADMKSIMYGLANIRDLNIALYMTGSKYAIHDIHFRRFDIGSTTRLGIETEILGESVNFLYRYFGQFYSVIDNPGYLPQRYRNIISIYGIPIDGTDNKICVENSDYALDILYVFEFLDFDTYWTYKRLDWVRDKFKNVPDFMKRNDLGAYYDSTEMSGGHNSCYTRYGNKFAEILIETELGYLVKKDRDRHYIYEEDSLSISFTDETRKPITRYRIPSSISKESIPKIACVEAIKRKHNFNIRNFIEFTDKPYYKKDKHRHDWEYAEYEEEYEDGGR